VNLCRVERWLTGIFPMRLSLESNKIAIFPTRVLYVVSLETYKRVLARRRNLEVHVGFRNIYCDRPFALPSVDPSSLIIVGNCLIVSFSVL
jgi:hypothetical protein